MPINQKQSKFNLSVHISVKESQNLKFNHFFLLVLWSSQCHRVWVGTAHRQKAPDWTIKQKLALVHIGISVKLKI